MSNILSVIEGREVCFCLSFGSEKVAEDMEVFTFWKVGLPDDEQKNFGVEGTVNLLDFFVTIGAVLCGNGSVRPRTYGLIEEIGIMTGN